MTFVAKVVKVRRLSANHHSGQAEAIVSSRQITVPGPTQDQMDNGDYPIVKASVHLKVQKGQELAIDTTSNTAEYCSDGTRASCCLTRSCGSGMASTGATASTTA